MRMSVCYLDYNEVWLCYYLVIHNIKPIMSITAVLLPFVTHLFTLPRMYHSVAFLTIKRQHTCYEKIRKPPVCSLISGLLPRRRPCYQPYRHRFISISSVFSRMYNKSFPVKIRKRHWKHVSAVMNNHVTTGIVESRAFYAVRAVSI
jgi:hypothetical protein